MGLLMTSPAQSAVGSILGILLFLLVIVINPLAGVLLWLVVYPFTEKSINISLGAGIPDLSPTRFCTVFLTMILLAQIAVRKRSFFGLTSTEVFGSLFVLGMILSIPRAVNPVYAAQIILDVYLVPIITYFIVRNLVVDRKALNVLLSALLVIAAYAAIYAIFEQLTGVILFTDFTPEKMINIHYSENLHILKGLFGGTHIFSVIFTMTLPIVFYRLLNARKPSRRNLYLFLLGLIFVGLYYTYKRTSWVSMLVSFVIMLWFYPKFRSLFIILLLLGSVLLAFTWESVSESAVVNERLTYKWETANDRTEAWETALTYWRQAPIFGYGFRRVEKFAIQGALESMYLHILTSAGLVGMVPYLLVVICIVKDSIAIFRQSPSDSRFFVDRELIVVFWAGYSGYLIKATTGAMLNAIVNILVFAFIGALVGSQKRFLRHEISKTA
jgi:O-antigen ligase